MVFGNCKKLTPIGAFQGSTNGAAAGSMVGFELVVCQGSANGRDLFSHGSAG